MITTIQINEPVKQVLNRMKHSPRESYEEVILQLIKLVEMQKRKQEELLIQGCKEMARESLKLCEEFKYVDAENLPEWEGNL